MKATRLAIVACSWTLASACAEQGDALEGTSASVIITDHCRVRGFGLLPGRSVWSGDIVGESSTPEGTWSHLTESLESISVTPDHMTCRINGATVADIEGSATFGGVPGYDVAIHIQDRGDPGPPERLPGTPEARTLRASKSHRPNWFDEGGSVFLTGATVRIPEEIPVTEGNAGNGIVRLTFVRPLLHATMCAYQGGASVSNPTAPDDVAAGSSYRFRNCVDLRGGNDADGLTAGSEVEATAVELHVHSGADRQPTPRRARTAVAVDLQVTPFRWVPREPDYYRIVVWSPEGDLTYVGEGDLKFGDVKVSLLP